MAFDIINQIRDDLNSLFVTMTVRNAVSNASGMNAEDDVVCDVTTRGGFQAVKYPITYYVSKGRKDGTVVGHVRIYEFSSLVEPRLEDAICTLQERDGINALVLDVRGNMRGRFSQPWTFRAYS